MKRRATVSRVVRPPPPDLGHVWPATGTRRCRLCFERYGSQAANFMCLRVPAPFIIPDFPREVPP